MATHSIEYNDIILSLSDLISSETNKYLDKKSNKSKFNDDTIKIQVNNFFKTDPTIISGAEAAAAIADKPNLSVAKRKTNIKKAITDYLKTVITETTVVNKYTELKSSGSAPVVLPTVPSGTPVVTALATATPITATGIPIVAPVVATTVATTGVSPYEIILDTDKMKFFVYNMFAHDLAHDLFPTGLGQGRVEAIEKGEVASSSIYKFLNRKPTFSSDVVYLGGKRESYNDYLQRQWYKKEETPAKQQAKEKNETENNTLISGTIQNKEEDIANINNYKNTFDTIEKVEYDELSKKIEKEEKEIEDDTNKIIVKRGIELTQDMIKSVGINLEQRGMLFVCYGNVSRGNAKTINNIGNKTFVIIDIETIINDYEGFVEKGYDYNPMYPGYVYYDNEVISPYDITVTKENQIFNIEFSLNNEKIKIQQNTVLNPDHTIISIQVDNSDNKSYTKVCYYDDKCGISFKEAYAQLGDNAYDLFKNIFYNYIIKEVSDGNNSDFFVFYPEFLLKKQTQLTREKFNKLFNNLDEANFDEYYKYYEPNFNCFQSKICKYLQKKHIEEEAKFLKNIEKQIAFTNINTKQSLKGTIISEEQTEKLKEEFISSFSKNIQNCESFNFLNILAKMFTYLAEATFNESTNSEKEKSDFIKKILTIINKNNQNQAFNEVSTDVKNFKPNNDPLFIQFLQYVVLHLYTYYDKYDAEKKIEQKGGAEKSNSVLNATNIICTSVNSVMYYLNKVTAISNKIVDVELEICNNMVLNGVAANIDDILFDSFYTWINMTNYNGDLKYYNNNDEKSLPKVSFEKKAPKAVSASSSKPATSTTEASSSETVVGLPNTDFWGWLDIKKPNNMEKNLFFISNAADYPNQLPSSKTSPAYLKEWSGSKASLKPTYETAADTNKTTKFCPLSSIIDGQPSCSKFISKDDIKEKGTLFVTVRNNETGSGNPNQMSYTVKVEPKPNSPPGTINFGDSYADNHKVLIHVLLKIGGICIINYGTLEPKTLSDTQLPNDPAIEMDLDDSKSFLDAKDCMIRLINLNIGLLKDHSDKARSWEFLMRKIKSDNGVPAVKMPFKLHTPGTIDSYTSQSYTSEQLRQLILRTSVTKSLGDYTQELNMVTKDSGYIDTPTSIPNLTGTPKNFALDLTTKIRKPDDLRLGFSKDRPSGVRLLLLKLFGKKNSSNPRSGLNERSIVGYYDTLGKAFIAYNKDKFASPTDTGGPKDYKTDYVEKSSDAKVKGGNNINKVKNNTKRRKNLTKKQKKLLKNRKISKKNNKGTRKRK
jgi:hypothetical protein